MEHRYWALRLRHLNRLSLVEWPPGTRSFSTDEYFGQRGLSTVTLRHTTTPQALFLASRTLSQSVTRWYTQVDTIYRTEAPTRADATILPVISLRTVRQHWPKAICSDAGRPYSFFPDVPQWRLWVGGAQSTPSRELEIDLLRALAIRFGYHPSVLSPNVGDHRNIIGGDKSAIVAGFAEAVGFPPGNGPSMKYLVERYLPRTWYRGLAASQDAFPALLMAVQEAYGGVSCTSPSPEGMEKAARLDHPYFIQPAKYCLEPTPRHRPASSKTAPLTVAGGPY